ncbi:tetratricopeptide repeat protein [Actinomadura latina]|uniref:tetratricopeptide repeat protein n=1 Tax=Actinomadura latina TaxID=163603 RepID=UPI001470D53C|nr:tetratricopeptide repeat protein [Actinomadura latina]
MAAWQAAKTFLLRRKTGNVDVSITSGDMRFNMSGNMDSEEVRRIVELLLARDQSTAVAREEGILTAFKGAKGEDHPDTLASASKLASAYQDAGRIQEAINLYESTLDSMRRVLGEDHADTLASASKLASAYQDAGRIQEAINLYESTLDSMRRVLGEDHADTLASASKLASAYRDMESRDN